MTMDTRSIVSRALEEIQAEQSPRETKANTWVVIVGGVLTVVAAGLTYGLDHLLIPSDYSGYVVSAVAFIGYVLTALKISKTPNSVTPTNSSKVLNKVQELLQQLPETVQDRVEQARSESTSRVEQWIQEATGVSVDLDGSDIVEQARVEAAAATAGLTGQGLDHAYADEYVGDHRVAE